MESTATLQDVERDPWRFFWYGVWILVMGVGALPLLGYGLPALLPYVPLLLIHEFAAFTYVGHTFFSNIWAMRLRMTQPREVGIWARAMLRAMALGITATTAVIIPISGLMLVQHLGGLQANPWAWDAYFAFWLMAGISVVPDVIRYGRNRHSEDPAHGVASGAIRGMIALALVIYILVCMIAKVSLIAP